MKVITTVSGEVFLDAPNLDEATKSGRDHFAAAVKAQMMPRQGECPPGTRQIHIGVAEAIQVTKVHDDYPDEVPK